ncbi:hypothetical protein [Haloparvum sp. PAK95]|uniref:hypothetical protein n=1 Tax=Haloparvum sp. PAK95 TaxID=3418962 RepID=UPI003D2F2938
MIGRAFLRYTVVYAGTIVGATALVLRNELAMLGIVGIGFFVLMVAGKGVGGIQSSTIGTTAESAMFESGNIKAEPAKSIPGDEKLLLFGCGVVLHGFAGLVLVGELLI